MGSKHSKNRGLKNNQNVLLHFFYEKNLLEGTLLCEGYHSILQKVKFKRNRDGIAYRCYLRGKPRKKDYISIRRDSFFSDFKNNLGDVLIILYYFYHDKLDKDLSIDFEISKYTIQKIKKK